MKDQLNQVKLIRIDILGSQENIGTDIEVTDFFEWNDNFTLDRNAIVLIEIIYLG